MAIILIGEAMLELSGGAAGWQLGFGGDTLNTAIHLARAGHEVAYLTAIGSDAPSSTLTQSWAAEGLDTALVLTHPVRSTGLYAISTDAQGERTFSYWRDTSAAREMFDLPGSALALDRAGQAEWLGFSLITLAILPPASRERLLDTARTVRGNGGQVVFDGNYRPRLWPDALSASRARDAAIAVATIGLPTLEDEVALSGESSADAVAAHWQRLGCRETVVKLGAAGCRLPGGEVIEPASVLAPVDTSGAGDAFNAGYISARLREGDERSAAHAGHALAGWTILRPGAIPAREP
jgi:2-dehydro-3-deoxygluconokinase